MPNLAQDARSTLAERRVDPGSLTGRHKSRKDKAERMESVMEGREVTPGAYCTEILSICIDTSTSSNGNESG